MDALELSGGVAARAILVTTVRGPVGNRPGAVVLRHASS